MKSPRLLPTLLVFVLPVLGFAAAGADPTGYRDTPLIPGSKWKVHDDDRPRPAAVQPGEKAGGAPADAFVIFDGSNTNNLVTAAGGAPCSWPIENGELLVKGGDCLT